MSVSLDVKPELQDLVREEAQRLDIDPLVLLSEAVKVGLASLSNRSTETQQDRTERNARLVARLRSFAEGDPEQQQRDLVALQAGLEEARSGQRRLFGEGVNP